MCATFPYAAEQAVKRVTLAAPIRPIVASR
jgi:hypothetical protein